MNEKSNVVAEGHAGGMDSPCSGGHDFEHVPGTHGGAGHLILFCHRCGEVRKVGVG